MVIISLIYISTCENPGSSLEESVAPYLVLQAINDASNSTIILNKGEAKGLDSYFSFNISKVAENKFVKKGLTEGWCLEWDKPISQNNDAHQGIEMYSTYGNET